jgi:hypothetical protein
VYSAEAIVIYDAGKEKQMDWEKYLRRFLTSENAVANVKKMPRTNKPYHHTIARLTTGLTDNYKN